MMRTLALIVSLITAACAAIETPVARADDHVTYEVFSDSVGAANIEYFDHSERKVVYGAQLPWRADVAVVEARRPSTEGAEIRADWRAFMRASPLPPGHPIGYWVTVRISVGGQVLCQSTLDLGDATCYGSVPHRS
jgi:hypothetical protein